jgi:hypothetical protein
MGLKPVIQTIKVCYLFLQIKMNKKLSKMSFKKLKKAGIT